MSDTATAELTMAEHDSELRLRRLGIGLLGCGLLAILFSVPVMPYDREISTAVRMSHVPGDVRKAIELSEAFAHASGVVAIFVCLLLASRLPRRRYWTAVAMTAVAGLTANLLKAAFVRPRPYTYDAVPSNPLPGNPLPSTPLPSTPLPGDPLPGGAINSSSANDVTGWEFLGSGSFWDASVRSFPSGHTATAWALAISLSLLYPRAAPMFCIMAGLATYQRLYGGAHFPSDTLAGFGIACLTCGAMLCLARLRQNFRAVA